MRLTHPAPIGAGAVDESAQPAKVTKAPPAEALVKQQRWTLGRIRKATLLPKPKDECSGLHRQLLLTASSRSAHENILRHIANHATIIEDGRSLNRVQTEDPHGYTTVNAAPGFDHEGSWLLVPVSAHIVDALAEVGTAGEDLEDNGDAEPNHDAEGCDPDE